ncbi:G patch domain-containing protein 4, partial [Podochytrium sp. JEL0797]
MSFGGIGTSSSLGNTLAHQWATGNFGSDETSASSSVAVSHLQKLGWKHGDGLGKNKDGINRAISVGFKNDTKGIGSASNEFGFSWWDHVFNKASSQIQIHKEDDGEIQVKVDRDSKKAKSLLYGSFTTEGQDHDEKDYSIKVTDEELFIACEGRTARKGARSEQPGKLLRATKKHTEIVEIVVPELVAKSKKEKKERKEKKRKAREEEEVVVVEEETVKKSKKRKSKSGDDEGEATLKIKKSKKSKKVDVEDPAREDAVEPKKKKSKRAEAAATETDPESAKPKKKKSKKESTDTDATPE